jgi:hypothetical protein
MPKGARKRPLCFHWSVKVGFAAVNMAKGDPSISTGTITRGPGHKKIGNKTEPVNEKPPRLMQS